MRDVIVSAYGESPFVLAALVSQIRMVTTAVSLTVFSLMPWTGHLEWITALVTASYSAVCMLLLVCGVQIGRLHTGRGRFRAHTTIKVNVVIPIP